MTAGWSREQLGDCADTTVLITGANSGLGFEATTAFAQHGATVIMACRSADRGNRAAADIRSATSHPEATLDVRLCDLADLDSVGAFADGVRSAYDKLDILCNNAGVMAIPRQETADGFEKQLGVNHLGHFALTGQLLDLLFDPDRHSRVVTHSSAAHEMGAVDFADLHSEETYGKWAAYGQSKLANLLFAYELQRRLTAAEITNTISVACHPGFVATNLQYRGPKQAGSRLRLGLMKMLNAVIGQSAETGVLPLLFAATAPDVTGGEYYGPDGLLSIRGAPEAQASSAASHDRADARRLWERSEELTDTTYPVP